MDTHAPEELLLAHQAFLRRLARSLVGDAAAADDLVQETALAALRRPPRVAGSPRAWLARVMRRLAVDRARTEARRRGREQQVARPEREELGAELAAELDVQRRVVAAVARLDEPYRSAVLLRYGRDLSAVEVAAELGVPVATVPTRLARALERLRRDLDARDEAGRPSWSVVLLAGLSDTRPSVVGAAAAAGGAIVGAKLAVTAAIAAVALTGTWWMLRAPAPAPAAAELSLAPVGPAETPPTSAAEVAARPEQVEAAGATRVALAVEAPVEAAEPRPDWGLRLTLRGVAESEAQALRVELRSPTSAEPEFVLATEPVEEQVLDLDEFFDRLGARPDQFELRLDHPGYLPASVDVLVPQELLAADAPGGSFEVAVELQPYSAEVLGVVHAAEGFELERVRVAAYPLGDEGPVNAPVEVVRPQPDGAFRLRLDAADAHVVVAFLQVPALLDQGPRLRPESHVVSRLDGASQDLGTLELGRGESIAGYVEAAAGEGARHGRLVLERDDGGSYYGDGLTWVEGRFELMRQETTPGADGSFRFDGLARSEYALGTRDVVQYAQGTPVVRIDDGRAVQRVRAPAANVRVASGRLRCRFVVLGDGRPVERASVTVAYTTPGGGGRTQGTRTDELGSFWLELDLASEVTLRIEDPRFPVEERLVRGAELEPEGRVEVNLQGPARAPATLAVRLEGAQGLLDGDHVVNFWMEPAAQGTVESVASAPVPMTFGGSGSATIQGRHTRVAYRFDDGLWTLSGLPRERFVVRAIPTSPKGGADPMLLPTVFEVDLRDAERVEHVWRAEAGGLVRLNLSALEGLSWAQLRTPDGVKVPASYSTGRVNVPGNFTGSAAAKPALYDVRPALPAGRYLLMWQLTDGSEHRLPVQVEAGRVSEVVVDPEQP